VPIDPGRGVTGDPVPDGPSSPAAQPSESQPQLTDPQVDPQTPAALRELDQQPNRTLRLGSVAGGGTFAAPGTDVGDVAGANATDPAPAAGAGAFDPVGSGSNGQSGTATTGAGDGSGAKGDNAAGGESSPTRIVTRPIETIVEKVPEEMQWALAGLAVLVLLLGAAYLTTTIRARRLARQRHELLQEVGLLQTALLPPVPDRLGGLRTSVAYRPADGPGAGGDFYDALALPGGRVGFILGDVSGHGRGALARTAFMRYTLRAYLEAGLEPRVALQVAGRVIDDGLGGDFATVLLAVHDPETGSLTYASAGHPAPIVTGPHPHTPVTAASSPPIGVGVRTGLRQTTVPLVPGSAACLFTDGLIEARTANGGMLGREQLEEILNELGADADAQELLRRVADVSRSVSDDMAAVLISPASPVTASLFRTEQLELSGRELEGTLARRFLESCDVPEAEIQAAEVEARSLAARFGGVVLHVVFGNRHRVEVLPRNVESIEAASRRVAASAS
jgi:hypothetical protein